MKIEYIKVGDKVRVSNDTPEALIAGRVGVVVDINKRNKEAKILIDFGAGFDGHAGNGYCSTKLDLDTTHFWAHHDDLEPLNAKYFETGNVVVLRNGDVAMVSIRPDLSLLTDGNSWTNIAYYDGNFTHKHQRHLDIMAIYGASAIYVESFSFKTDCRPLLWERVDDKKEMTVDEIEKALGHRVKVVK